MFENAEPGQFTILLALVTMITYLINRDFGTDKVPHETGAKNPRYCYEELYLDGCWYYFYSDGVTETVSNKRMKQEQKPEMLVYSYCPGCDEEVYVRPSEFDCLFCGRHLEKIETWVKKV